MFEHSSGRLYFFDAEGAHILDGDTWSYHKFTPPLPVVRNGFPLLRLVEGPRGEVYVWTENCGGLQVHNGMAWKSYAAWDHPALGKIDDVLPQPDGTIRVFDGSGEEATVALSALRPLPPPAVVLDRDGLRDARNQRSRHVWWTKTPLADFIGEELAAYGMFLAKDGQGRVYFSTGPAGPGPGPGFSWIAVFDPRYREDVPTLKYECVRLGGGHRAIRLDSQQRLWARLSEKDQPFLSRYDGDGWTHFADPTPATAAPSANRGASKPPRQFGPMTLSAAMPDGAQAQARQRPAPALADPSFFQTLRHGAMVASSYGNRTYLFDGQQWNVYDSLRDLVDAEYAWLKEHIDNGAVPYSYGNCTLLAGDATGRVWVSEDRGLKKYSGAYNGTNWSQIPQGGFRLSGSGRRAAIGGLLYDSSVWPPKALRLPDPDSKVWFDRDGDRLGCQRRPPLDGRRPLLLPRRPLREDRPRRRPPAVGRTRPAASGSAVIKVGTCDLPTAAAARPCSTISHGTSTHGTTFTRGTLR